MNLTSWFLVLGGIWVTSRLRSSALVYLQVAGMEQIYWSHKLWKMAMMRAIAKMMMLMMVAILVHSLLLHSWLCSIAGLN